ncbi:hypothetical protein UlMin_016223 [Ulmus minor]
MASLSSRTRSNNSILYKSHRASSAAILTDRSSSPTRVSMYGRSISPSPPSVRFSIERPSSPRRSISERKQSNGSVSNQKRTCMCSPTSHPGSFRCSLHKNSKRGGHDHVSSCHSSSRLNCRRSAMTNSLVRIGGVEGDLVKRALSALIRPSSHQQRRREAFRPRPSRLSAMSKAEDL